MDDRTVRLECLKILAKDLPINPDIPGLVSDAKLLYDFVNGPAKKRGRPPKADKAQAPAKTD